jgi:type II restriction/modification system DNA methylase subunit YeeA
MTPAEFIRRWTDSELRERQGAQSHFNDLCALLGEPTPAEDDNKGDRYCFERGAAKTGGGEGWADVWRRGCFGWEYKGKHKNLDAALRQLQAYAFDLENPPYLVVSDMDRIIVHTNWTNTVSRVFTFTLDDLREPAKLDQLRLVFQGSERLKPNLSPQEITAKAAALFGGLGQKLQDRGHRPRVVAHFLNRLVFCMFAEDARLLPTGLFSRVIRAVEKRPEEAASQLGDLFTKMGKGGFFGADEINWFNGGLFDDAGVLPLDAEDLKLIGDTAGEHDWSEIDPAIFGNLFEQALKATRERPALGAHYTDREKILKIVEPVIVRPLMAEWEAARAEISAAMDQARAGEAERKAVEERGAAALREGAATYQAGEAARRKDRTRTLKARTAAEAKARERLEAFLVRLAVFRVLDPACGSGNFLYVALRALKDIELRAIVDADRMGVPDVPNPRVDLHAVRGIEIEEYAAELARVALWIGYLQWMRQNGFTNWRQPILSTLDQIECRDALLNKDGSEAEWPKADVIIGNPPFVGNKRLRRSLGDSHLESLFSTFTEKVSAEADFVCYWIEKAWAEVKQGRAMRAELVTTNSIRGGANKRSLDPIAEADAIKEAWADEPWELEGAAVRVSMVGFGKGFVERRLNGLQASAIRSDLSAANIDFSRSAKLKENAAPSFQGPVLVGDFDVPGDAARRWLVAPLNPNGRPNSEVLRPLRNGKDITGHPRDVWVIDFHRLTEQEAAFFEAPFDHVAQYIKPVRQANRRASRARTWWRHGETGVAMWRAMEPFRRYVATSQVAKHRIFIWLDRVIQPHQTVIAIARDDDTTFGILSSRLHELWSLRMGTSLEDRPRYTPSTTFETYPFPEGFTPNIPAADYAADPRAVAIAEVARELNQLRDAWLNPPESRHHRTGDRANRSARRGAGQVSRPHAPEGRGGGEGSEKSHADQTLQRAASMAVHGARAPRCSGSRRLRLAGRPLRRGYSLAPVRPQSGPRRGGAVVVVIR